MVGDDDAGNPFCPAIGMECVGLIMKLGSGRIRERGCLLTSLLDILPLTRFSPLSNSLAEDGHKFAVTRMSPC